jgi:hypothetical protein
VKQNITLGLAIAALLISLFSALPTAAQSYLDDRVWQLENDLIYLKDDVHYLCRQVRYIVEAGYSGGTTVLHTCNN